MMKRMIFMALAIVLISAVQGVDKVPAAPKPSLEDTLVKALNQVIQSSFPGYKFCPPPYTQVLDKCFYVHWRVPKFSWPEADLFCRQAGGFLAEPRHFGAIIANIYNHPSVDPRDAASLVGYTTVYRLWLGGRRTDNGTFAWHSGRTIFDPVDDQTSRSGHGDCIAIYLQKETAFNLRAYNCDNKEYFVCQLS